MKPGVQTKAQADKRAELRSQLHLVSVAPTTKRFSKCICEQHRAMPDNTSSSSQTEDNCGDISDKDYDQNHVEADNDGIRDQQRISSSAFRDFALESASVSSSSSSSSGIDTCIK